MAKKLKTVNLPLVEHDAKDLLISDANIKHLQRKIDTAKIAQKFNKEYSHSLVYLQISGEDQTAFQIKFRVHDEFVDSGIYDRGNAVIYPSKALYEAIQDISYTVVPNAKLNWNNTGTIGWLPY